ncbi:hypothetical protein Lalb_Chr06g0174361 [Lupinus albus]|uniref:Uncharacterized protein n=1 Tax=Lupinus albus TaxID=3870 RepID=A0A6A4QES0_LUPAL|nr:hypothetical protein Lalb_Chr06g0174361 [Lupinus albus]
MFGFEGYKSRKAIASHLRMQSIGTSPGASFRISDTEIFLYTGIENAPDEYVSGEKSSSLSQNIQYESAAENRVLTATSKRPNSVGYAAARFKRALHWHRVKDKKVEGCKKSMDEGSLDSCTKWNSNNSDETPISLR